MPNIKSAIKRAKITTKKTEVNKIQKSTLRTVVKKAKVALDSSAPDAKTFVNDAVVKIDKAASKGYMHKNTAARRKSKLTKAMNSAK